MKINIREKKLNDSHDSSLRITGRTPILIDELTRSENPCPVDVSSPRPVHGHKTGIKRCVSPRGGHTVATGKNTIELIN